MNHESGHLKHPAKRRVGIICGGKSAEHAVSILSAKSVVAALDKGLFEPVIIGIDVGGGWHLLETLEGVETIAAQDTHKLSIDSPREMVDRLAGASLDVVFPVLHGPFGEDGTIQGLLELMDVPYVGCGVLASAVGMDKDVMKRLLRAADVPIADFVTIRNTQDIDADKIIASLGLPLFVKPANMGSSVGVSKVTSKAELTKAVALALQYDRKVLIEKAIAGDEIECAVFGNAKPRVSVPGRIIPKATFYDYEAKYKDESGTVLEVPAQSLSDQQVQDVQTIASQVYSALECEGLARIDMFMTPEGNVVVNEINTIPGFTKYSMYPLLWQASGVPYSELITHLIQLAEERFVARHKLLTSPVVANAS